MPLLGLDKYQQAVDALIEVKNKQVKAVFIQGLTNIAIGTPVDEGFARNNWFLSENAASDATVDNESKSGANSLLQLDKIPANVLGIKLYYTNNTPYINKLEYGGYPNPTDGTPLKGGGFDKHTVNGFSDQAPTGWVRSEILIMRQALRAIK